MQRKKKVVCDSLLFSYQKWKWVHKALESLRADLVITANKRPGRSRKLPKINPCFCAWTLFTQSCCYKLSGECCAPKNTPKAEHFRELFSEIWWQLTIETDTLCQNRILLGSQSWPGISHFQTSCQSGLVAAAPVCLPLILTAADNTLSLGNLPEISGIPHADFHCSTAPHGCATWCISVLQGSCCIWIISMQFSTSVGYRHMKIRSRGYSSSPPSQPFHFLKCSSQILHVLYSLLTPQLSSPRTWFHAGCPGTYSA